MNSEITVTDAMIEAVEEEVGMGHVAWDMIAPRELIAASVKVWLQSPHGERIREIIELRAHLAEAIRRAEVRTNDD